MGIERREPALAVDTPAVTHDVRADSMPPRVASEQGEDGDHSALPPSAGTPASITDCLDTPLGNSASASAPVRDASRPLTNVVVPGEEWIVCVSADSWGAVHRSNDGVSPLCGRRLSATRAILPPDTTGRRCCKGCFAGSKRDS